MARTEEDSLGTVEVPEEAYYGAFTARAQDNFDLTGAETHTALVRALGAVKEAAARANRGLGLLDADVADAIVEAAQEVQSGELDDQFVLDPIQAGAGTPVHMNANEVIANRATELQGGELGEYSVHPNDHVNMGQSSNNVVPTAARLATLELADRLLDELAELASEFDAKGEEFADVIKVGRTHLQDAVPVTLGQEFAAYATLCKEGAERLDAALDGMRAVGLGGNAVGTGINTPPEFRENVVAELADVTGRDLEPVEDPIATTRSMAPFAAVAGALDALVADCINAADDLMLLASGPVAGLDEIDLPEVEPGSSIMPGKVNPSIVEAFTMACIHARGNLAAVRDAAGESDLDMHVMTPVIAHNLFEALDVLAKAVRMLRERCVDGIAANEDRIAALFDGSTATATALSPYIGYDRTASAVHAALDSDMTVREVVEENGWMTAAELDRVLDPERMTAPHGVDETLQETVQDRLDDG